MSEVPLYTRWQCALVEALVSKAVLVFHRLIPLSREYGTYTSHGQIMALAFW